MFLRISKWSFSQPEYRFSRQEVVLPGLFPDFSVAGILSIAFWHGLPLGVDFRGGTLVYVEVHQPARNDDQIRAAMERAGVKDARIQRYGASGNNEVLMRWI